MHWSVVGHEQQKAYIERLLERGAFPHAMLFAGPEGVGKRMMADDLRGVLVADGYQFDWRVLAPEQDEEGKVHAIGVEPVRELKKWLSLRPMGTQKVVVVDDADWLIGDAANTMLKMLEEPPAYAHFLLVTSRLGAIMPTIASRCQLLTFQSLEDVHMNEVLGKQRLDGDERALLAAVAAGRPGAALRLISAKRLPRVAGAIAGLERALKDGVAERLIYAKELADADDTSDVVDWWLAWTRSQLATRPQLAPVAANLLELHDAVADPVFNRRLALDRFFLSW